MKNSTLARALLSLPVFALVGGSTLALATPDVRVIEGSLKVKGPGCAQDGSVFADILGDGKTVQFLFTELFASTSLSSTVLDQKLCNASVDVEVPAGYQIAPGPVSMEATVTGVSETGSASVYARYFLDGKASDFISQNYSAAQFPAGGQPQSITLESADASSNPASWSGACGGVQKINLMTRAIARRGATDAGFTEVFVDRSVNRVNHNIACHLVLKPCGAP